MAGFSPQRRLEGEIWLVRPFWRVGRQKLRAILREIGWEWREDASNLDPIFRRNRVRSEILPLLAEIAGRETDEIALSHAQSGAIWRDEAEFLESLAGGELEKLVLTHGEGILILDGLAFGLLPIALQRRVLRRAAREIVPDLRDLGAQKIEITRLWVVENQRRAVWQWSRELSVEWTGEGSGNRLRFRRV